MKRMLLFGCVWSASMLMGRAVEENFSQAVRAEDFSAAGLAKLSPVELARLDALVRDFKSGALIAAEAKAAKAEAGAAKEKKSEGGLLAKAKVLLTPGTEVDYEVTESRIVGDFTGWEGRPIFTLENGQRWQLANPGRYYSPVVASPKVKITPATMGGFWLTVEGVGQRVKVVPVGGGK